MIDKKADVTNYSDLYKVVRFVCSDHAAIESFSAGVYPDFNDTEHVYPSIFFETGQLYTSGAETRTYTIALHLFDMVNEKHSAEDIIETQTKLDNILHEVLQELRCYKSLQNVAKEIDILPTSEAENDLLVGLRAEFTITIGQTIKRGDKPFRSQLNLVLPTTV